MSFASFKTFGQKVIRIIIGLFFMGTGTSILLSANLGASTMGTLSDGLHSVLPVSVSTANILVNLLFLLIVLFADRSLIHVGTVLATFFVGLFMSLSQSLLGFFPIDEMGLLVRMAIALLGILLLSIGLGYYISVDYGLGPYEAVTVLLQKKVKWPLKRCKQLCDFIFTVISIFMGATWGVGTFMAVLLTGPIMQRFLHFFKRKQAEKAAKCATAEHAAATGERVKAKVAPASVAVPAEGSGKLVG